MDANKPSSCAPFEPPGGVLIWIIVFVELITFMMGLGAFLVQRSANLSSYSESQRLLNPLFGFINTVLLVSAGFFMAAAVKRLQQGLTRACVRHIAVSIFLGLSFLAVKGCEYSEKLRHGLDLRSSDFFMFYWLLTGFHFVHVVVGVAILTCLLFSIRNGHYSQASPADVEAGAIFWHMCDLIWLLIFPLFYLL